MPGLFSRFYHGDSAMDANEIGAHARILLGQGTVSPTNGAVYGAVSPGRHFCGLCLLDIAEGSMEIEERAPAGNALYFHPRCHGLLCSERSQAELRRDGDGARA